MKLKLFGGKSAKQDEWELDARYVEFRDESGRTVFYVRPGDDGRSIEVRGVDTFFMNGVAYGSRLAALPNAANSLTIQAAPYKDDELPASSLS